MVGIEKNFDIMFFLCVVVCLAAFRLFVTLVDVAILFRLMYDGPDGESTWEFFIFSPIRKRCRLLTITDPSFIMLQIIVLCCAAPILVAVYVFLYYNAIAKHRLAKPNGREWEQITDQYLVAVPLWFFCLINVVKSAFRGCPCTFPKYPHGFLSHFNVNSIRGTSKCRFKCASWSVKGSNSGLGFLSHKPFQTAPPPGGAIQ